MTEECKGERVRAGAFCYLVCNSGSVGDSSVFCAEDGTWVLDYNSCGTPSTTDSCCIHNQPNVVVESLV